MINIEQQKYILKYKLQTYKYKYGTVCNQYFNYERFELIEKNITAITAL